MTEDTIVEEMRRAGEALFARFDNDLHAVCAYLRNRAQEQGRKTVAMPPKRVLPPKPTKKVG